MVYTQWEIIIEETFGIEKLLIHRSVIHFEINNDDTRYDDSVQFSLSI